MKHPGLILASKSSRRRRLLEQVGLDFGIVTSHVDERLAEGMSPESMVKALAEAKAREVGDAHPQDWIIGADTIVLIDGSILGKPASTDTARRMIQQLSGRVHQVLTGFTIYHAAGQTCITGIEKTDVYFKQLSHAEIEWYLQTKEPFDKAGAYAIQGLGSFLVKQIHGSYSNVVGLPICEVLDHLFKTGVIEPASGGRWRMCEPGGSKQ